MVEQKPKKSKKPSVTSMVNDEQKRSRKGDNKKQEDRQNG